MLLEYQCTLNCNYRCDYCTCGRNDLLETPIQEETEENVINFLKFISQTYTQELYVFGGEPFLAKNIKVILKTLNELNYPYVVQTNFSCYKKIDECFANKETIPKLLQISVHPDSVKDYNKLIEYIQKYQKYIRFIDVMFTNKDVLKIYHLLYEHFGNLIHIAPLADFYTTRKKYRYALYEFNRLKRLLPKIQFETGIRSFLWEEQMKNVWSPKGKKCMYLNGEYVLYSPDLKKYNCSHRMNAVICPNDSCFML